MKFNAISSFCSAISGMLFATAASAQEILPFPPTPSASKAGLTIETPPTRSAWSRSASRTARRTS